MPKQIEQEHLVFGDLKSIYKKQATGSYEEIGKQYRHLQEIEEQLFVGFTSYILAKAGYNDTTLYKTDIGDDEDFLKTTEEMDNFADLVISFLGVKEEERVFDTLGGAEEIFFDYPKYKTWSHCYQHTITNEKLKVIFTQVGDYRGISPFFENPNWKSLRGIDPAYKNIILVNPSIKLNKATRELQKKLLTDNILLITVQDLTNQFVVNAEKKRLLNDWITVRNAVLGEFAIKEPVVAEAIDPRQLALEDLIKRPESDRLEFKSSITYDYKLGNYNKEREDDIAKALSALMNTEGGVLIIGIDDNHNILGLEKDLQYCQKNNEDGLTLHLTNIIGRCLGNVHHQYLKPKLQPINGKLVVRVNVSPSSSPAFVKDSKGRTNLYIRANNSSRPLELDTAEYIKQHWG